MHNSKLKESFAFYPSHKEHTLYKQSFNTHAVISTSCTAVACHSERNHGNYTRWFTIKARNNTCISSKDKVGTVGIIQRSSKA